MNRPDIATSPATTQVTGAGEPSNRVNRMAGGDNAAGGGRRHKGPPKEGARLSQFKVIQGTSRWSTVPRSLRTHAQIAFGPEEERGCAAAADVKNPSQLRGTPTNSNLPTPQSRAQMESRHEAKRGCRAAADAKNPSQLRVTPTNSNLSTPQLCAQIEFGHEEETRHRAKPTETDRYGLHVTQPTPHFRCWLREAYDDVVTPRRSDPGK